MQPTADIDVAKADIADVLRGKTDTVANKVPHKLSQIVHETIPTLMRALDLYREVEGQLSISSRNFLWHALRGLISMLQVDDELFTLSQAINEDADMQANFLESLVLLIVTCSDHDVQLTTVRNSP